MWILVGLSGSLGPVIYYAWIRRAAVSARERPARLLIGRAKYIDGASLADLPENTVVRAKGQVRRLERELRAPIRGQPCVYWRITAAVQRFSERRGRYGQRHSYWQDMIDHSEGVPFVLADGASECSVDPALGTVSVGKPLIVQISRGQVIPSSLAVMLAEQRVSLDELRTETWRFEQTMVAIDASVVVVGAGRRVDRSSVQGERDYRAAQSRVPRRHRSTSCSRQTTRSTSSSGSTTTARAGSCAGVSRITSRAPGPTSCRESSVLCAPYRTSGTIGA